MFHFEFVWWKVESYHGWSLLIIQGDWPIYFRWHLVAGLAREGLWDILFWARTSSRSLTYKSATIGYIFISPKGQCPLQLLPCNFHNCYWPPSQALASATTSHALRLPSLAFGHNPNLCMLRYVKFFSSTWWFLLCSISFQTKDIKM